MQKRKRILLLIETSRSAGREIIEGISRYVVKNQNWMIHLNERHIVDKPTWLESWRGDGIITRTADINIHKVLNEKKIPFVELHGDNGQITLDVLVDEEQVAQLAADHLWNRGYQHYAFFAFGNAWWIESRSVCFAKALKKYGAKSLVCPLITKKEIFPSTIPDGKAIRKIASWLLSLPKPIGIWTATDLDAFYVLEAAQLAGTPIPEEIAVLGTDNDPLLCRALVPQLSSVDINAQEIGYRAAELLEQRMVGKNPPVPIMTSPSHVHVRQSTDIIAIQDSDVARAVRYIRENSNSPKLKVEHIADWCDISVRTLQLKFKKQFLKSPEEEILRTRIEHACRLLRDSDIKVSCIGEEIGFASASYFFHVFQKKKGLTPLAYRNIYRETKELE